MMSDELSTLMGYYPGMIYNPKELKIDITHPVVECKPPLAPKNETHKEKKIFSIGKITKEQIFKLSQALSQIRIKPAALKDILYIENMRHGQVLTCEHTGDYNKFYTTNSSYGSAQIHHSRYRADHRVKQNGILYGQDYVINTHDISVLGDGHGKNSERLSHYVCENLYTGFNEIPIENLLKNRKFNLIQFEINSLFMNINNRLQTEVYSDDIIYSYDFKILKTAGTTCNVSKIYNVKLDDGTAKRYIVSANVGDSETGVILRKNTNNYKIVMLSENHNAEEYEEARRIKRLGTAYFKTKQPIYNRFGMGTNTPESIKKHLDNRYSNLDTLPIFKLNSNDSVEVDEELKHKMLFGCKEYGKMYNIYDWVGGIQSLRTYTIEKKINGQWIQEAPIATHSSINMGSSLNGQCQVARGFEGMEDTNDPTPCINIYEIPPDVHATLVSFSDGYGDTVHWSEVADEICKIEYGSRFKLDASYIVSNLRELMYRKIIGKENQGFRLVNQYDRARIQEWDDISLSVIDCPPIV